MSWFAEGAGGLREKFGDVLAVAKASGIGTLLVIPRLWAEGPDEEPIELEDIEFLSDLQASAERADFPWRHIDFVVDQGRTGEAVRVNLDADADTVLRQFAGQ